MRVWTVTHVSLFPSNPGRSLGLQDSLHSVSNPQQSRAGCTQVSPELPLASCSCCGSAGGQARHGLEGRSASKALPLLQRGGLLLAGMQARCDHCQACHFPTVARFALISGQDCGCVCSLSGAVLIRELHPKSALKHDLVRPRCKK